MRHKWSHWIPACEAAQQRDRWRSFSLLYFGWRLCAALSDELPEDDPIAGARDLAQAAGDDATHVVLVGITCGLSAPYVAGQVDAILRNDLEPIAKSAPKHAILLGFNPAYLSRDQPIAKWKGERSFRAVVQDLLGTSFGRSEAGHVGNVLLNPVVGPEPLTASSRMKGGSATKIILDVVCAHAVDLLRNNSSSTMAEGMAAVKRRIAQYREAFHACYSSAESISSVLKCAGDSLANGGHVYWLGAGAVAGILAITDASEMPDTYGAPFDETRAFCDGGWTSVANAEGDLSTKGELYHISIKEGFAELKLGKEDTCIVVGGIGDGVDAVESVAKDAAGKSGCTIARIAFAPPPPPAKQWHGMRTAY